MTQLSLFKDDGFPSIYTLSELCTGFREMYTTEYGREHHRYAIKENHKRHGGFITDTAGNYYRIRTYSGGSISFQTDERESERAKICKETLLQRHKATHANRCGVLEWRREATCDSLYDYDKARPLA